MTVRLRLRSMASKKVHWRAPKMVNGFDDGSLEAKTVHWRVPKEVLRWRVPKKVHWRVHSMARMERVQ